MPNFNVSILRTSYAWVIVTISADTEEEAKNKAYNTSGDFEYKEKEADYFVDKCVKIKE